MENHESPEQQTRPKTDNGESLPAPTDYKRNVWMLILMVSVVVLAWLISLIAG